jgi:flagellar motor switch protein FliM
MKKTTEVIKKTKVTKHNLVKEHLIRKKSITSLEAIENFSATRLSAIIFNLRKSGFNIVTRSVPITDRYGNTGIYGNYVLISTPKK